MDLSMMAIWYLAFLLSTVCHEAAHAWAGMRGGDDTAARGGQVSLDPWPHIRREPYGMVVIPLITSLTGTGMFGWASAPYDPLWAARHPRRAAWMALAGPVANALLALLAAACMHAGLAMGLFRLASQPWSARVVVGLSNGATFPATFLSVVFSLNLILFAFNMIPLPPLDGSSAMTLLMPERLAVRYRELALGSTLRLVTMVFAFRFFGKLAAPFQQAVTALLFPSS